MIDRGDKFKHFPISPHFPYFRSIVFIIKRAYKLEEKHAIRVQKFWRQPP